MESRTLSLLNLLNTGFTIIENGLFCGGEHRKRKIAASIGLSLTKWGRLFNRTALLFCRPVKSSISANCLLNYLNLLPEELPSHSKTG